MFMTLMRSLACGLQVGDSERGFSVLNDGPLDMRMNPEVTAATHY